MKDLDRCDNCSSNLDCTKSQKFVKRKQTYSIKMNSLTFLSLGFLLISQCVAQDFKLDVENLVNSLDFKKPGKTEPVALHWGIADTSAVVGKMFNYVIPSDAFKGDIISYKIMEVGKDGLPVWLHFDSKNHQLKGIPSPGDLGQHYLEVVVKGLQNSVAKDVFSVTVTGESPVLKYTPSNSQNGKPQVVRCRREVPETAVTIVVDADLESLPALNRLDLVNSAASYLGLANDMMKLLPKGDKPMIDSSTLVAGSGNIKEPKHTGVQVSWLVGCGQVEKDHMPVLHHVEKTALNGSLARAVGYQISGWQVTNTLFQEAPHRRRRAIRATATPAVTRGPPTVSEVVTVTDPIKPTDVEEPMTRSIPIMVSPSLDIQATKSVVVPPATPEPTEMMTKVVTKSTPIMPPTTPKGTPKPVPTKTEILPTKTHVMTAAPPTKTTTESSMIDNTPKCDDGSLAAPIRKGKMDDLVFTAGESSVIAVPDDLFYDCLEGSTGQLRLDLFIDGMQVLSPNSWIGLQRKNNKWFITGAPLANDMGMKSYRITAQNRKGLFSPAFANFMVTVIKSNIKNLENPSHELGLVLDEDFDKFTVAKRMILVNQIKRIYRDDSTDNISILKFERGSVKFGWTNNTLPTDHCPIDGIKTVVGRLVKEDGQLTDRARRMLKDFSVNKATAQPKGECLNNPDFPVHGEVDQPQPIDPIPDGKTPKPTPKPTTLTPKKEEQESDDDMLITTVVPAVVIIIILLIALFIACCLYRKRRKGKMSLEDKNTFVNKGAPIIFPDEYDEKPNDANKPLIMDDEKPPMPPPEYTRASSESSRSSDHKNEEYEEHDMTDMSSPMIQPPPPIHSSGGNKQPRPHMQTAYNNKPAPYVPP
ncbi:DAG1 [Mytilus edulis]|uniref:Dystroglycan 1 n=1 Tax=Mytilus edulis TaxID=6550 RepID=A0A8S3T149_MYTED|nr:DAG1 [Mytilus edulis]